MELDNKLRRLSDDHHVDFFGVADLAPAHEAILEQGGPVIAGFPRAISIGIALFSSIVDQLPQRSQRSIAMTYRRHCYDVVNERLDNITSQMGSLLESSGYATLPVPASQIVDDDRLHGIFSNKMAAHLAGLGWIRQELFAGHAGSRAAGALGDRADQCTPGANGHAAGRRLCRLRRVCRYLPAACVYRPRF